jgi:dihydropteroate synthase
VGILNVTPDSFSDGGRFTDLDAALLRVEQMLSEGAAIIDVGGESTRPRGQTYGAGASAVTEDEEMARVLPVVEAVAERFPEAIISLDSYKPPVAKAALGAGAHILNDVTGLRYDDGMARLAALHDAPLILMHSLGRPGGMPQEHRYADVTSEVAASLAESVARAQAAGAEQVVVDPGFGFGKSARENLRLINELEALQFPGCPVLVGISRKSTIGVVLGSQAEPAPVDERLFGTLGATAAAVMRGATLVRTHDVRATRQMIDVLLATLNEQDSGGGGTDDRSGLS